VKRRVAFLFTIWSASAGSAEPAKLSCSPVLATGLEFNKQSKQWEQATPKRVPFTIEADEGSSTKYVGIGVGGIPFLSCRRGFDEYGYLSCEGSVLRFIYSNRTNRYVMTADRGYFNSLPDANGVINDSTHSSSLFLEIGTCVEQK
jgi:hypothetical protein